MKQINKSILIIVMAMFLIGLVSGGSSYVIDNRKPGDIVPIIKEKIDNVSIDNLEQEDLRKKSVPFLLVILVMLFFITRWLLNRKANWDNP